MNEGAREAQVDAALRERLQAALADRYAVADEIGHGASAVVFAARDLRHFDREVALKVIRPEVAETVGVARFRREMQLAAQLNHPHILALLDWGEVAGLLYYVMPRVTGETLRARLQREHQLALDDAVRVTRDIASALHYAHDRGIVHRDVKPENILLTGGVASLGDFGLARDLDRRVDPVTASGIAVGTAAYMSPEQTSGGTGDARSDQYALACVLYEMLAGDPPFHASTVHALFARHRNDPVQPLASVRPSLPSGVDEAVQRALAKVPADRFANVGQFAQAVETALTSGSLAAVRVATPAVPERPGVKWQRAALGGLAIVALAWWLVKSLDVLPGDRAPALVANRIAVVPFETFHAEDSLWRTGLVDLLSRSLDGAGPLRTVAPSVVLKSATGRSDNTSAERVGRETGAGLAIFGQLLRVGVDSARLQATLYDVAAQRVLAEDEVRDEAGRVDRLADSLTVRLLRALVRTRAIAATPRPSLGSASLPALKAFLQAEQAYRLNDMQSAQTLYERSLALDSSFALAYHGMSSVRRAIGLEGDSQQRWHAARAGERNRGLGLRDSLLLVADSIMVALPRTVSFLTDATRALVRRRVRTLELAAATYVNDPVIAMELGEALAHTGFLLGRTQEQALQAFERAIVADPGFTPAYYHAVELALALRGADSARQLARAFVRARPGDARLQLAVDLLSPDPNDVARAWTNAARLAPDTVASAAYLLLHAERPPNVSVRLYQTLTDDVTGHRSYDTTSVRYWTAVSHLYRGRFRAAAAALTPDLIAVMPIHLVLLGEHGSVRPESVDAAAATWSASTTVEALHAAIAWYGIRRDTASLKHLAQRSPFLVHPRHTDPVQSVAAAYMNGAVRAYLALARQDTAGAARGFAALADSLCVGTCWPEVKTLSRLFSATRQPAEAARLLDRHPPQGTSITAMAPLWTAERGRVAIEMGDTPTSEWAQRTIGRVWTSADSSVRRLLDASALTPRANKMATRQ